ncbi:hypothetical protein [Mesorhizobium japonicum]|jgi:hypothetical protein|uniref:hypothetical protein n=1 Tax=Mesorhizobium japonicum TaxID=2066070 RepID=UPI003B5C84AD
MNLAELRQKIIDDGGRPDRIVVSTREEDFDERGYNVVPQPDGTFIIIQNDGRGKWRPILERMPSLDTRVFRAESDYCDWIWNEIQTSKIPPELTIVRTPEEEAEWQRQADENYKRIRERFEAAKAARATEAAAKAKE